MDKSVIIIGAGISGLAAAVRLKENGFQVTVLEAQEKAGGRVRTDRSSGIAFDEGASWIHGPDGNPVTPIAEKAGASYSFTDFDNLEMFDKDGSAYSESEIVRAEEKYFQYLYEVEQAGDKNRSFEAVFNSLYPDKAESRMWKYLLSAYLEFDTGADIS